MNEKWLRDYGLKHKVPHRAERLSACKPQHCDRTQGKGGNGKGGGGGILTMILRVASRFGNALQGVSYHLTRRARGLSGRAMGD